MHTHTAPDAVELTLRDVLADGVFLCVRLGAGAPLVDACRAAVRGGLSVLEITLTTPGALRAIEAMAKEAGAIPGGGTVLTPDDARRVADAGGRFAMSPVFDPDVVDEAHRLGLLAIPGTSTPTEILAAHRGGARLVKVFPAAALGGPAYIRAVRGPLPDIPLVPTNGITPDTVADYLAAGAVMVGVGGDVFPPGFSLEHVEAASRRVRAAMNAARAAR
ncbi:MAG: bifunctional 4-hydroxy-2-oxoglutarate aldolase/2-dehydro-3-deoxy-phosphogluconate aldolase [Candidatus Krumholzibacteria bacterium]|nr:bifunctional 4-hydroxy-2-oxoglutarate aldolase/2-dehydro-3-deoxy-phosphogluconate aldolase [Candidatus Krumholzibacteria bacterium]MDH4338044.1 bifunctional 4-hydroxy-2-oxoglutarate aldolase/2-dehydro-3-deoxy-phosphogluconate aldolase [Candidatus Krumholzibacteria bacterium]MDH5269395.1 bifunctional 4-hydroxy-2-oxoglutarate aldolase/2-dehydro-3-deoxy-phosphogluconate aldolase [Candidatus Krumholzibacteria bacterium]MDH5627753.1 bifunctional 4-hydroxy-2-oxoglutarate aldolase/2-dehydro-3-deoxy-